MLSKHKTKFAVVCVMVGVYFLFLGSYEIRPPINKHYYQEYVKALKFLERVSGPDDVVLTEWSQGNQLVTLINRKVIATSKVYPSESGEIAKRYRDLARFFFAKNESVAQKVLKNYRVSFIFIRKDFNYKSACKIPKSLCKKEGSMIARLLGKAPFSSLTLIFESKNFLIYRVKNASHF